MLCNIAANPFNAIAFMGGSTFNEAEYVEASNVQQCVRFKFNNQWKKKKPEHTNMLLQHTLHTHMCTYTH